MSAYIMEALLAYWLSWYVMPRSMEDGLNPYVFSLAIQDHERKKLTLASLYLGYLYTQFDEFLANVLQSTRRYNAITHFDSCFLQMFLWERFL